jgi:hypothetical protein
MDEENSSANRVKYPNSMAPCDVISVAECMVRQNCSANRLDAWYWIRLMAGNIVNLNSIGGSCRFLTMGFVTALITSHNIVNPNSMGGSCKLMFKPEHLTAPSGCTS